MIKNRVDLKGLSKELSQDISNNYEWLSREISFVVDGSYNSEKLNSDIINFYDKTKEIRGKRNKNLVSKIGQHFIKQYYGVNSNQALKIYNYLSNEDKKVYNDIIIDNLDYYMENLKD